MNVPPRLSHRLLADESMRRHTSLCIGGRSLYFLEVRSFDDLADAGGFAEKNGLNLLVMGKGTNLLVADTGVEALVARLSGDVFSEVSVSGRDVSAGAAAPLASLVRACAQAGAEGFECLGGIPGTVGGALKMNAGGKHGTVSDCISEVEVIDRRGTTRTYTGRELAFSYRHSPFAPDDIIISACFHAAGLSTPDKVTHMTDAVIEEKRKTQPLGVKSCGCVFRNPEGDSAGRMIDACGLKGMRAGDIEVSEVHANYLVNRGRGTSRDMVSLMDMVYRKVRERFDTGLEAEVVMWGDCGWTHGSSGPDVV